MGALWSTTSIICSEVESLRDLQRHVSRALKTQLRRCFPAVRNQSHPRHRNSPSCPKGFGARDRTSTSVSTPTKQYTRLSMDIKVSPDATSNGSQQHTISCTECQRRKQKCSRQWPCNHCQSRKVPHMCHFSSTKKSALANDSKNGVLNGARKRKGPEHDVATSEPLVAIDGEEHSAADALKALGYLQSDGDPLYFGMLSERHDDDRLVRENEIAIKDIPPRIYCDAIVQNYTDVCNYWYYPIYPPQFLAAYNEWWTSRAKREKTKPEFTCLLLRVLSNSTQCVAPDLKRKLESELGESLQDLTQKYHDAAERLSNMIPPGTGGIMQVQQLFLTAVWMKCESLFINAWHSLSDAIRYAQEVGLHNESLWSNLSEFDREIRRRVWTTLYIWDRLMAMLLSRPLLINERHCSVQRPTVNLEYDPSKPDLPCPHQHMVFQQDLCEAVMPFFGSKLDVKQSELAMAAVSQWLDSLPPVFRLEGTDTKYDESNSYIKLQRLQTVAMGHTCRLSLVKMYLTQTYEPEPGLTPKKLRELQSFAINECVTLMKISQMLADMYIPDYNKYFLIVFCPLDIAALLCSTIIHDVQFNLPRRGEVLEIIAQGQSLLRRLAKVTRTGAIALKAVNQLVAKFDLTPGEVAIFKDAQSHVFRNLSPSPKRPAVGKLSRESSASDTPALTPEAEPSRSASSTASTSTSAAPFSAPSLQTYSSYNSSVSSAPTPLQPVMPSMPMTSAPNPNMMAAYPDPYLTNDFGTQDLVNFDFGALQPIFNWRNVNLFDNNDHVFDFAGAP